MAKRIMTCKIKQFIALIITVGLTSFILAIFSREQSVSSLQEIVTQTHKHLENFKDTLTEGKNGEKKMEIEDKYLSMLGFNKVEKETTQALAHRPNFDSTEFNVKNGSMPIVVVTAVGKGQSYQADDFIQNVQSILASNPLVIWNIDPNAPTSSEDTEFTLGLKQNCNSTRCWIERFNFEDYPDHVKDLSLKAFRPIIIQTMLDRGGCVLWLDLDRRLLPQGNETLGKLMQLAFNGGSHGVVGWSLGHPTSSLTHPKTFPYFQTEVENFYFHRMIDPSQLLICNTNLVHTKVMLPWVECTLTKDCINPFGSQSGGCRFDKKPLYRYSGCHAYDSSALNVALGMAFPFHQPYISRVPLSRPALISQASNQTTTIESTNPALSLYTTSTRRIHPLTRTIKLHQRQILAAKTMSERKLTLRNSKTNSSTPPVHRLLLPFADKRFYKKVDFAPHSTVASPKPKTPRADSKNNAELKTNFSQFHKKKTDGFQFDIDSNRQQRLEATKASQKEKRGKLQMEKRNIGRPGLQQTSTNSKPKANAPSDGPSASRREKLLKWKNEKETARAITREVQKPLFKPAVANPKNSIPIMKKGIWKPPVPEDEKRVTRSMKTHLPMQMNQNITLGINAIKAKTKVAAEPLKKIIKPSLDKSKYKPTTPFQISSVSGIRAESAAKAVKQPVKIPSPRALKTTGTESNQVLKPHVNNIEKMEIPPQSQPPAQQEVRKKTKGPKKFDTVYMRFTDEYMKAGRSLMQRNDEWNKYLETEPEIPEIYRENLASAVGKANLLVVSKLPQFIELLYFYLNGICDPGPILECDLQGWWDVVSIQLDLMDTTFEKLDTLRKNEWKENVPETKKILKKLPSVPAIANTKPKTVRANGGLMAFLAAKRNGGNVPMPLKEDNVENSPSRRKSERKNPISPSVSNTSFGSPSRRNSSINTSLRMLAVRNSMGSITRIGAQKVSATDIEENGTIKAEKQQNGKMKE